MEHICHQCPSRDVFVVDPNASPLWRSVFLGATLLAVILGGVLSGL